MIIKNINNLINHIVFTTLFISKSVLSDLKNCKYDQNICNHLNQVVGIKTPIMVASGTIIDDDFIVTNRHVVEDHKQLIIRYYNGEIINLFINAIFYFIKEGSPTPVASKPPSTAKTWPVMYDALLDAKK